MTPCPACPYRNSKDTFQRMWINDTGSEQSHVLGIGEAGGKTELEQRKCFVGRTGDEIDLQYFLMAGLQRPDVHMTNAMRCVPRDKSGEIDTPTDQQAASCVMHHMPQTLAAVQPEYIILLGAVAIHAVLGPQVDIEHEHGLPYDLSLCPPESFAAKHLRTLDAPPIVMPTYHPAAGMRDGSFMVALQEDFRNLRLYLRGDYSNLPTDQYPNPDYVEVRDTFWSLQELRHYLSRGKYCFTAADTEHDDGKLWCVTVSTEPGSARFIDATNQAAMNVLRWHAAYGQSPWLFHAVGADLPLLQDHGINPRRWRDTFQMAYWLCEFRRGLKTLAYRNLGMRMQDYTDVVGPPSKQVLYEYMCVARESIDNCIPKSRKPKSLTDEEKVVRKVRNSVNLLVGDLDKKWAATDPWERMSDPKSASWTADRKEIIKAYAEIVDPQYANGIPQMSIRHVERSKAVFYASRDSDSTLRLRPILQRKTRELRKLT